MAFTQDNQQLRVRTSLGTDDLLISGFTGNEGISQLFNFQLDLLAPDRSVVDFEKLLGQPVVVTLMLPNEQPRFFHGMCSRLSQGSQDGDQQSFSTLTNYRMEVVPRLWLLTKRTQSRIFQHLSVPDILRKVLEGLEVSYEIAGTFRPRDFCVQYRESDFDFASRLMEEEGIFYFFEHTASGHKMIVANTPQAHRDLPDPKRIIYEAWTGGVREDDRIVSWEKTQEIRSGKYSLWDHCFELPHKHLDATEPILASVQVGTVTHKLRVADNSTLEQYDYPGGYAQRFDGVNKGGGDQPSELQKIFEDNKRTTGIRIQQETVPGLTVNGTSNCRHFMTGYKFSLERHFDGDGDYVLTQVSHFAAIRGYRSGETAEFTYQNSFKCIPFALPFRPSQVTRRPVIHGTQTAIVVGPAGEEIFTDKYGRVKVQFHWDREGKMDADSSCWVRVAQDAAGKKWGALFLPRIGHEVVVDFEEGDPDRPIIVGSVYNASEMPPYKLPDDKTKTVLFKSNSSKGGGGFNEIRIEDSKGKEQIFVHGQRDQDIRIEHDQMEWIGNNSHLIVQKDQVESIQGDNHQTVAGDHSESVGGTVSLSAGIDMQEKVGQKYALDSGMEIHLKSGLNLVIESGATLTLKVAGNFININPGGIFIRGTMVMINSGGAPGTGAGSHPEHPKSPKEADKAKTGEVSKVQKEKTVAAESLGPTAMAMQQAAHSGAPFCEI
ncbi:MAG: type VI secretion system Vgr family protein [Pyrinomonadaceae bacterium]